MDRKKIAVLTGAGISAESGLKTFRDSDGLWNGFAIHEVATPEAWAENPQVVLDFYNMRRKEALQAQPNAAHLALATLERCHDVHIITQNVDDLHERAGSQSIVHLHGELLKMRSSIDPDLLYEYVEDIHLGDLAADGAQLRPHIVWFGEDVPLLWRAIEIVRASDILVVIGTSLQVYPAAGLLGIFPADRPVYVIDKSIPSISSRRNHSGTESLLTCIEKPATVGVADLMRQLHCHS